MCKNKDFENTQCVNKDSQNIPHLPLIFHFQNTVHK